MIRWVVVAAATMALAISCLVDRKSTEFQCDDDADCADLPGDDRTCKDGFCVLESCPSACDSCSTGKICNITCATANECRTGVSCPAGYNCRFQCNQDCTPVTCTLAASCQVSCNTNADCGPLVCGTASPCSCTSGGGTCL